MVQNTVAWDSYWRQVDDELGRVSLEQDIQRNDFYSEAEWTVYYVHCNGLRGYRLFASLSIPTGDGPFPGLVQMPDYQSAVDIPFTPLRRDMVVLNATHRGQRGSETPFRASYPGLLTQGIGNSSSYILRRVYADALRMVDLLMAQPAVDCQRISVAGAGLGGTLALAAGAFRPHAKALAVDTPLMIGSPNALELAGDVYPLGEMNDYFRAYPGRRDATMQTLEAFSPLALAERVTCPVLIGTGARDRGQCPPPLGEELAERLRHGELHQYPGGSEGGGYAHAVVRTRWLRERMGLT